MKLFIIEDNRLFAHLLAKVLKLEDYEVSVAYDGKSALEFIEKNEIHLILLDLILPDMEGTEILTAVRKNYNQSEIPVIALSASTTEQKIVDVLSLGANDFVAKPYNIEILKLKVKNLLDLQQTYKELKEANVLIKEAGEQYLAQAEELRQLIECVKPSGLDLPMSDE